MIEVIIHGRGAQGAVTFSQILAVAANYFGRYCQAFPSFGPERCGAPVEAYARIADKHINLRSQVYNPNIAVVLDASLLKVKDITASLRKNGIIIVNTNKPLDKLNIKNRHNFKIYGVDATSVALKIFKKNIVNTAMLGAFVAVTGLVTLESVYKGIEKRFEDKEEMIKLNKEAVKSVYDKIRKHITK